MAPSMSQRQHLSAAAQRASGSCLVAVVSRRVTCHIVTGSWAAMGQCLALQQEAAQVAARVSIMRSQSRICQLNLGLCLPEQVLLNTQVSGNARNKTAASAATTNDRFGPAGCSCAAVSSDSNAGICVFMPLLTKRPETLTTSC
jgi:hypothetical protein